VTAKELQEELKDAADKITEILSPFKNYGEITVDVMKDEIYDVNNFKETRLRITITVTREMWGCNDYIRIGR
jgi:hypothetical protein